MWNEFTGIFPEFKDKKFTSWYFCNTQDCANKLAELVLKKIKKGTTSLHYWYEKDREEIPREGEFSVITDWDGIAKCIIRNKKITLLPFREFSEELAYIEGEGDRSLEYWREVHLKYFSEELLKINLEFNEDMEIVFEEFETVFPN